jgi:hypothetical protein
MGWLYGLDGGNRKSWKANISENKGLDEKK